MGIYTQRHTCAYITYIDHKHVPTHSKKEECQSNNIDRACFSKTLLPVEEMLLHCVQAGGTVSFGITLNQFPVHNCRIFKAHLKLSSP